MAMLLNTSTISDILQGNCSFKGNENKVFNGFQTIEDAIDNEISWIRPGNKDLVNLLQSTKAGCIVCTKATFESFPESNQDRLFVLTDNPQLAFTKLLQEYDKLEEKHAVNDDFSKPLIHPTAIVHSEAELGDGVRIGAYSVIEACQVGANTIVGEYVKIFKNVTIGKNCHIRENCSIGGAGFGITKDEQGQNIHMPHVGKVLIEDNVLIFPFTNIDRATLGTTKIGTNSVIDHYCHIGHNSSIGNNTIVTAQVVLAGGSQIGDRSFIGVNTIVKDKIKIGSDVTIGMGSVVVKNVPDGETWFGNPAKKY